MTVTTYDYAALRDFAAALGERAGLPIDRAKVQAEILLEADLMGHTTHGLAMLPGFLKSIESGAIRAKGEPDVISDRGSTLLWDARTLPGTWIVTRAINVAAGRAADHGVATIVIRNTAHIAALGAYLRQATAQGIRRAPIVSFKF
jgi:LDH2 family malate/lactate/ureidoglycolate dehydrogenase